MEKAIQSVKQTVNKSLAFLAAFLLAAMAILVIYQVFTRYVLNDPSGWTQEIIRYLLIWTGFSGAAYAFGTRQHMALVLFRDKLKPEKRKWLIMFIDIVILLFALFVMVIGGAQLAISVLGVNSALVGIPRTLVYAMAPVSGVFIVLIQMINLWEDHTGKFLIIYKEETEEGGL